MNTIVAASTACLPGVQPLSDRIEDFRRHGITTIELGAGVSVGDDLNVLFAAEGVQFLVHNYFPPPPKTFVLNLASADLAVRAQSLRMVEFALDLSARLKAPFYSVHGGFITDPIGFDGTGFVFPAPQSATQAVAAMERFIDAVRSLLTHARTAGVKLLVENNVCVPSSAGKLLLQSADEFESLFASIEDPHLGVLLDTGHLNVTARTFGFDRLQFVDRLQPFVRAFHIHDNDGSADTHRPVVEGSWVIDVLRRDALGGLPIVVESKFATPTDLAGHLEWLQASLRN